MARKVLIQLRRGLERDIGTLAVGELGYCTDTQKLYIGTASGNVLLVAAQTVGDMLKSIYDTNNNGKVDAAEVADSVPWAGVSGKPSTFTPATHNHGAVTTQVDIATNGDLNSYTSIGFYRCAASAAAATLANCPTSIAFSLFVELHAGVKQTLTEYVTANPRTFIRNYYSGTWGPWIEVANKKDVMPKGPLTWNQLKGV